MLDINKKYLITGASGFLGEALITRLISMGYKNLRAVARNEGNLVKLKEKYSNIEIVTGDIADECVCEKAVRDVDGIFHLAAFKHIGLAEENPAECTKTNVIGSMNLLKKTFEYIPDFIIGISTDKAAQVNGVYGATKMLMERLFKEAEEINMETKYRIVRYGNILYSTGSVLCKWKDKIIKNEEIEVTNLKSSRFYWTVNQAVDLIFECLEKVKNSKPYCPQMKSIELGELLKAMIKKYNPNYNKEIKQIGLQQGENMHETIDGENYSCQVEKYTQEEIYKMI